MPSISSNEPTRSRPAESWSSEWSCFGGRAWRKGMHLHRDERGTLLPLEFSDLPFTPCRAFIVSEVPTGKVRGRHAHRDGDQFLVCLAGRVLVDMRYQERHEQCVLEDGSEGLFIGSGVWAQQTYLEEGSMLLVFASVPYERDVLLDIRDLSAN